MIKLEDVKPLHNLVAIRQIKRPGSLIHTPDNASQENQLWVVLASGPGRIENSNVASAGLKRGDVVVMGTCHVLNLRTEDGTIQLVSDDNICAIVGHVDVDEIKSEPRLDLS